MLRHPPFLAYSGKTGGKTSCQQLAGYATNIIVA